MSPAVLERPALVSRAPAAPSLSADYLRLTPQGATWTRDPSDATTFASMREATRAALRLPSGLRAFSLPLASDIETTVALH